MKIYTKTGDKGQTSLIGGTRVPKDDIRIEAYGTVDELNSWMGVIRDSIDASDEYLEDDFREHARNLIINIQDKLFTIGSHLASDPEKSHMKLPAITDEHVELLEKEMDAIDKVVPPMKNFVLPGGDLTISYCHVARCVCRRAERCVIHLSGSAVVEEIIIRYLNRLSDYLFMLSRKLTHELEAKEIPWKP